VRGDTELVQDGLISSNNIEQEYSWYFSLKTISKGLILFSEQYKK